MILRRAGIVAALVVAVILAGSSVSAAAPAAPAPRWDVQAFPKPTNFGVGAFSESFNAYEVVITNLGGAPATGKVEVNVQFPPGVTVTAEDPIAAEAATFWASNCAILSAGSEVDCTLPELKPFQGAFEVHVDVAESAALSLSTKVSVAGGGAATVEKDIINQRAPGRAAFGISAFESYPTGPTGESSEIAGGHPTRFNTLIMSPLETRLLPGEEVPGEEQALARGPIKNDKDLVFDLPVGFVGNPLAAQTCPIQVFLGQPPKGSDCPASSQVGTFAISGGSNVFLGEPSTVGERNPIYNLAPEAGYPAALGFYDKGLSHGVVAQATLAHTADGYVVRVIAAELVTGVFGPYFLQTSFFGNPLRESGQLGVGRAFLTNPASCAGNPLKTELHLDTWSDPAPIKVGADAKRDYSSINFSDPQWLAATDEAPAVSGCEALSFTPSFVLKPTETAADSATGLRVNVTIPQNEDPEGLATPPLRDATVQLPAGLVANPSVAGGLDACTEAQLAPTSTAPGACPGGSKVGTAIVKTPLIDHPLGGSVFIGAPDCGPCGEADASSGRLLKLYIEINDPATGIVVKLPGKVSANPTNGQLTATFKNNPQLPFEDLELQFKSGSRAPLTTPPACGVYTTATDLMPWSAPQSGPDTTPQARFNVTSGPRGSACASSEAGLSNVPAFEAGTAVPLAGTYSPFVLKVGRENGSQRISSIDTTLPLGLAGKLAGIPYCSDAAIAATASKSGAAERANPSCPLASEVGIVNVGAGSGAPFYVQGRAYLAGPYKGAPLSLEIITPAVAGPFDLGTVAVRTALYVDEYTAQIHAVSDPIPSILAGIPLDIRSIALNMNRPQFTLNPTSCNSMMVLGSTTSTLGQSAALQNRFQVGGCKGLGFKPALKLSLKGPTKRSGHPALKAVVTYPKQGSYANIARAQVGLPHSEFLDQGNLDKVCKQADLKAGTCPKTSIYGKAKAWTPLLDKPLQGPVYLGVGFGFKLPALVADLNGQVRILLKGKVDTTKHEGIRNTFVAVPDAPVSRFVLEMKGGKKYGLLVNSENICRKPQRASALFNAQNGNSLHMRPKIANSCKSKSGGKRGK